MRDKNDKGKEIIYNYRMKYVEIAVLAQTKENFDTFIYSFSGKENIDIGQVDKIPLRNKTVFGVALKFTKKPDFETKEIIEIFDIKIPKHLIEVARWMSEYYIAYINSVLRTILPTGFYKKRRVSSAVASSPTSQELRGVNSVVRENKNGIPRLTSDQEIVLKKINQSKVEKP